MAVPFAMPEEDINDLIRMVIAILSQARINQADENQKMIECMEELMKLLIEEMEKRSRFCIYDKQLRQGLNLMRQGLETLPHNVSATPMTIIRSSRRTNSESSCCDDKFTKIDVMQEYDQINFIQRISDMQLNKDTLEFNTKTSVKECSVWKLVRESVRTSFWKAVPILCVVGWHLFQSTSSCGDSI